MVEKIKRLCQQEGVTINAVELKTGIGRNNIVRWDEHPPGILKVKAVADYFGVSVDYLLDDVADEVSLNNDTNLVLEAAFNNRPEMRILFSTMATASKEDIEQAIKIIEALKK